ncbi:methylated-DNA--[protein]-cysteine S-methyltransferase [Streptomyces sp. SID13031]|uniref:methylated-DNA--[protein]-cysteine S-methyltransferase n=1 Tax=Streptomyces sp. SID13031 TaxID=2706046 RepID=UPI0013C78630|nr:methylated-DNA--[protein]-cysteine S-methyltransferase [Streptomyces sp. SID13031]NEA37374.1 methylated-DNA--[protein]-cysteine S-methyltransferase [Streptomyces sp. SID13031]
MAYAVIDSPLGPLTLVAADTGELAGLYMEQHRHRPAMETFGLRDDSILPEVQQQLKQYFAGERTTFDVPLKLAGTPFQQRVWEALQDIPYGEITTYGQLAATLGLVPGASRAVGLANGKNPVSIIVPCHRVIGSTGSLTGYGGGLDRKQRLLDHERADVLF